MTSLDKFYQVMSLVVMVCGRHGHCLWPSLSNPVCTHCTVTVLHVMLGMLDVVQQRLWDDFSKQPKDDQSRHYCQLMALGAALARCSTSDHHARAADFHCQLILHAISNHFYSILRPKILAATEVVS